MGIWLVQLLEPEILSKKYPPIYAIKKIRKATTFSHPPLHLQGIFVKTPGINFGGHLINKVH
jgi:hypothetical protein